MLLWLAFNVLWVILKFGLVVLKETGRDGQLCVFSQICARRAVFELLIDLIFGLTPHHVENPWLDVRVDVSSRMCHGLMHNSILKHLHVGQIRPAIW